MASTPISGCGAMRSNRSTNHVKTPATLHTNVSLGRINLDDRLQHCSQTKCQHDFKKKKNAIPRQPVFNINSI